MKSKEVRYPRKVFVLTANYKLRQITLVKPGNNWFNTAGITATGKGYHESDAYPTAKKAIAAGRKKLDKRQKELFRLQSYLDKEFEALEAAEASIKPSPTLSKRVKQ